MQDFTLSNCENGLWIEELFHLPRWNTADTQDKRYKIETDAGARPVSYFSVFGTVVEMVQKESTNFKLYTVDDGTGAIVCKQFLDRAVSHLDVLEDWSWKDMNILNNSSICKSYTHASTMCDTVFNNRTVQHEEVAAYEQARRKVLESLRWSIVNSLRSPEGIEVGDSVLVCGRLYTYFNINQIHVNAIRLLTMQEELALMLRKLGDSKYRLKYTSKPDTTEEKNKELVDVNVFEDRTGEESSMVSEDQSGSNVMSPLPIRRTSGLMTFDSVMESKLVATIVPPCGLNISLPPTPKTEPGILSSLPVICEDPPFFDTYFVEEVSDPTSDDDDQFIPPTPQVKRAKK